MFGSPIRLRMLKELMEGERSVSDLARAVSVKVPSLSQKLRILKMRKLVTFRRAGCQIYYRLASPAVEAMLQSVLAAIDTYRMEQEAAGQAALAAIEPDRARDF